MGAQSFSINLPWSRGATVAGMKANHSSSPGSAWSFWAGLLILFLVTCVESQLWWRCGGECLPVVTDQDLSLAVQGADISLAFR